MLWQKMRDDIPGHFPAPLAKTNDAEAYMRQVDEIYVTDAYHSLSIEGYQVSTDLIDRVRQGALNPEQDKADLDLENGLAARGYCLPFQAVKVSVRQALDGKNPGEVVDRDHSGWYRELLAPNVTPASSSLRTSPATGPPRSIFAVRECAA